MNPLTDQFAIDDSSSIANALEKITENKSGLVFIVDAKQRLIGSFSDGDYRSLSLNKNLNIDIKKDKVISYMNTDPKYIYFDQENSREALLNFFNTGFSIIPVLDKKRIKQILNKDNAFQGIPVLKRVFTKAPLRCSLAGGGTDLYEFYKDHDGAIISVLNKKICLLLDRKFQCWY